MVQKENEIRNLKGLKPKPDQKNTTEETKASDKKTFRSTLKL